MKRTALYATGSALALALLATSLPASADVDVLATIQKTKDITITEDIFITKTVDLRVEAELVYNSAAEADAIVNQENRDNRVDHSGKQLSPTTSQPLDNYGIDLSAAITDSINDNSGIVDVNQDVGNMTNQGNQVALAIATPEGPQTSGDAPGLVLLNSQSEAEQINRDNQVTHLEDPNATPAVNLPDDPADGYNKTADITNSINDNTGIVNVNQNAGNMNNQANSEAIAVAIDLAGTALSEAALGQVNIHPDIADTSNNGPHPAVFEAGVSKSANLTNSLHGNAGIGGVNQAAGNMANQANIFSLSFIDSGGGVGLTP